MTLRAVFAVRVSHNYVNAPASTYVKCILLKVELILSSARDNSSAVFTRSWPRSRAARVPLDEPAPDSRIFPSRDSRRATATPGRPAFFSRGFFTVFRFYDVGARGARIDNNVTDEIPFKERPALKRTRLRARTVLSHPAIIRGRTAAADRTRSEYHRHEMASGIFTA